VFKTAFECVWLEKTLNWCFFLVLSNGFDVLMSKMKNKSEKKLFWCIFKRKVLLKCTLHHNTKHTTLGVACRILLLGTCCINSSVVYISCLNGEILFWVYPFVFSGSLCEALGYIWYCPICQLKNLWNCHGDSFVCPAFSIGIQLLTISLTDICSRKMMSILLRKMRLL